jgi:peptidyl-prolyl cis-trans isomerase-like 4
MSVVIETTVGDITVDLYVKERPKTCLNFLKLCKLKYYNYNLFHTIEQNFLAQTGDMSGDGDKGESVWGVVEGPKKKFFETETMPKILHSDIGLIR